MTDLRVTRVNQCLDRKLLILGYEVPDILVIFGTLSILNYIFAPLGLRLVCVWIPSLLLALALRLGKRGKPDKHLVHLFRYHVTNPHYFSAFREGKRPEKIRSVYRGQRKKDTDENKRA